MLKSVPKVILAGTALMLSGTALSITETVVNLNVEHSVDGVSVFDRKKFITIHSSIVERDWDEEPDKLQYMLDDLDVYFGRDNGGTVWQYNQTVEDPERPGYADPVKLAEQGKNSREIVYGINEAQYHGYEDRFDVMIGGQPQAHYPGHPTNPCCGRTDGYLMDGSEAIGEFFARYIQEFFRQSSSDSTLGHPRPRFFEVLNEPLYELTTEGDTPAIDVFEFHRDVAQRMREFDNEIMIGGYTTAFPIFEERDFARWDERMKLFVDVAGSEMDFFSLHFYDFAEFPNSVTGNFEGPNNFKGSRVEGTLDMLESYSNIALGEIKPFLISEYSGRNLALEQGYWSAFRDWHMLKATSPMMLSFMDRPNLMLKAIPFVPTKAEWGRKPDGRPYTSRLLRQRFEAEGETGDDWVFTEYVKFYELWSDVNGTRVDTLSNNPDVMVDSYVDGNTAYVIVSNLTTSNEEVFVHKFGASLGQPVSVEVKHLYLSGNAPVLDKQVFGSDIESFTLAPEATAIFAYTFASPITINSESREQKYYSGDFLQSIVANSPVAFGIDNVQTNTFGEAVLNITVGRDQGQSLTPQVSINGTVLPLPQKLFAGDDQAKRPRFFGTLEVPVANEYLQSSNIVEVTFPDNGGHVASVVLNTFAFDEEIRPTDAPVTGIALSANVTTLAIGETTAVSASVLPFFAPNGGLTLSSSDDDIATVDANGVVTGLSVGEVTITATSDEGGFTDSVTLDVEEPVAASIAITNLSELTSLDFDTCSSLTIEVAYEAGTGETVTGQFGGIDYFFRHLTTGFKVVKDVKLQDASAIDQRNGSSSVSFPLAEVTPTAELPETDFYFLFVRARTSAGETLTASGYPVSVVEGTGCFEPGVTFDDAEKYTGTPISNESDLQVTTNFDAGPGEAVGDGVNGVRYLLRELRGDFSVVQDIRVDDSSVIGQRKGESSVSLPITGITPSSSLPDGHFYYLFVVFETENGQRFENAVFPITIVGEAIVPASIGWDDPAKYVNSTFLTTGSMEVAVNVEAGTGNTVSDGLGGVEIRLRHLAPGFKVIEDLAILTDSSLIGQQSGLANFTIPLAGATPTSQLGEGEFYFLFVRFRSSTGETFATQAFPLQIDNDFDGDGIGDDTDADDDNDGTPDEQDDFPFDDVYGVLGDFDGDGDVDRKDVSRFVLAIRNPELVRPEFDFNGDGQVTPADVSAIRNLCTRALCAE